MPTTKRHRQTKQRNDPSEQAANAQHQAGRGLAFLLETKLFFLILLVRIVHDRTSLIVEKSTRKTRVVSKLRFPRAESKARRDTPSGPRSDTKKTSGGNQSSDDRWTLGATQPDD
jgi:hypothetical protein